MSSTAAIQVVQNTSKRTALRNAWKWVESRKFFAVFPHNKCLLSCYDISFLKKKNGAFIGCCQCLSRCRRDGSQNIYCIKPSSWCNILNERTRVNNCQKSKLKAFIILIALNNTQQTETSDTAIKRQLLANYDNYHSRLPRQVRVTTTWRHEHRLQRLQKPPQVCWRVPAWVLRMN